MTLLVHRSERADELVSALGDLLLRTPADPMTSEVVSVPTRGVERWLTQRLATRLGARTGRGDGVCANITFPFPGSLVSAATARAAGYDPACDPWAPERAVWPLLEVVDEHLDAPYLSPLRRHLEAASPETGSLRRYATVRRVADLFDRYAVNRPDLIDAWSKGADAWDSDAEVDAIWQAELWRLLRARIGVASPAERGSEAARLLAADPSLADLPERVSLFGLTRLAPSHLHILQAVAASRDVHLFLLHPSPALWNAVTEAVSSPSPRLRRINDPTAELATNPLLRSWGRDAREMQLVLSAQGVEAGEYRPAPTPPATLLGRVQADIRADRAPGSGNGGDAAPDVASPLLDECDDSLQVHSCHGQARQVEVLRDAVLHLLASDPTLEPRDVIVLCPDIEVFAPLIAAAFGGAGVPVDSAQPYVAASGSPVAEGLPRLRVRLADRSLRQTNPLLAVAGRLLSLAASRMTASQVLDLAAMEAVSRRFGLDDDGLSLITKWVAASGVRWGLDGSHRARWHLEVEDANTWRAGIDRVLLGVAMSEDRLRTFEGVLPYDDMSSSVVDLAGQLAELLDRLRRATDDLSGRHAVGDWVKVLIDATESMALSAANERWQHDELRAVLSAVAAEADDPSSPGPAATSGPPLDLAEVTSLLEDRLRSRPTRANFCTGDLTVCTMVPMRSVPHRVVGLLGLDDGVFPRGGDHDGENLLLAEPRVGERDVRSEDRQLLLDALLAAGEHLIVTYQGHDLRTNQPRPPSVPVAELLDVVDRTVRLPTDVRPRDRVVVEHPLQSFDPRVFTPGALGARGPFGFDPVDLEGARAMSSPGPGRRPFLEDPLPPLAVNTIDLDTLVRFVQHPVQAFLRTRCRLYLADQDEPLRDDIPIVLDSLERWSLGNRLLTQRLVGTPTERVTSAERVRGSLPPGILADKLLADAQAEVDAIAQVVEELPCSSHPSESRGVEIQLADGRSVTGAVAQVRDGVILAPTYSKLRPKQRLAAWVRFVALTAASPDRSVSAVSVGRGDNGRVLRSVVGPLAPDAATAAEIALGHLSTLVDLWDRGMREPLPLYCATSAAWAAAPADKDPGTLAGKAWRSDDGSPVPGEDRDPYYRLVLGGVVPFSELLEARPAKGEQGEGWASAESTRFGRLAHRLWEPILRHEELR